MRIIIIIFIIMMIIIIIILWLLLLWLLLLYNFGEDESLEVSACTSMYVVTLIYKFYVSYCAL